MLYQTNIVLLKHKASTDLSEEFLQDICQNNEFGLKERLEEYRQSFISEMMKDMKFAQENGWIRKDLKYMRKIAFISFIVIMFSALNISGQNNLEFDGEASAYGNYSPDNELDLFMGGRYIPQLNYTIELNPSKILDFEGAANIYGSVSFHPFDSSYIDGNIQAYRIWARYTGKQFEIRLGLQKIDFGSALILRPLQWFDEIDPRDPLKFTNGVYGALGRYYFLNNANIWLWVLYKNEAARGFDFVESNSNYPEFGGRVQYPVPKGEIALSYNHRTADTRDLLIVPTYEEIPEDKFGLDGKWDIEIGLWFEACYIHKHKDVGMLTNQAFFTLGTDYTFGVGNGLHVVVENLIASLDENPFELSEVSNTTASMISYPLGLFNNLSSVVYYNWSTKDFSFFLNFEHQFKSITGYLMAYYNPDNEQVLQDDNFGNSFSGPGFRIMLVYNH